MKYILSMLLIIGMFASFVAALVAMLFFTQTVNTPAELKDFIYGKGDSTNIFEDYRVKEDKLSELAAQMEKYKADYKKLTQQAQAHEESLAQGIIQLEDQKDSLELEKIKIGVIADTTAHRERLERLKDLAKFYDKVKAKRAAEILQESDVLNDTSVATLMKMLKPQQMGKIMGFMDPQFAAKITSIMQNVSSEE